MIKLSREKFLLARDFIGAHARPLDRALFAFYFEGVSVGQVLAELAHYQNADGGFGHGMEPDFRLSASSPMATSVGLQYAENVDAQAGLPLVSRAIRYLVETCDRQQFYWPATSLEVNNEPHAPWWHKSELKPPSTEEWPNPSAELLGYLYRWPDQAPAALLQSLSSRAMEVLAADPGPHPTYNILCWQHAMPVLPAGLQEAVQDYLVRAVAKLLPFSAEKWNEMRAIWLASSPRSPVARILGDTILPWIEAEILMQSADGGWWPNWEWGQYPEAWEQAKREWAGKITVDVLLGLKQYGLLEV